MNKLYLFFRRLLYIKKKLRNHVSMILDLGLNEVVDTLFACDSRNVLIRPTLNKLSNLLLIK